jgi:hypothetical protein
MCRTHITNTVIPLPCKYTFTLMNFVINDEERFQTNSAIHSVNTRNMDHLHRPTANLSCFQKSVHYAGIKIINSLPSYLRSLMIKKAQFKVLLKRYLNTHSSYSVTEFLTLKITPNIPKSYFFLLFFVWILYNMHILYVKLFFVLSSKYFEKVFVCGFVILFLCCFCFVVAAFICMFCIFMTYSTICTYKLCARARARMTAYKVIKAECTLSELHAQDHF